MPENKIKDQVNLVIRMKDMINITIEMYKIETRKTIAKSTKLRIWNKFGLQSRAATARVPQPDDVRPLPRARPLTLLRMGLERHLAGAMGTAPDATGFRPVVVFCF